MSVNQISTTSNVHTKHQKKQQRADGLKATTGHLNRSTDEIEIHEHIADLHKAPLPLLHRHQIKPP